MFTAAYAALGAVECCREYRTAYLEIRRRATSPAVDKFYPQVEFNFALACHQAELLGPAEDSYHTVLTEIENLDAPRFVADIKMNLVDIYQEIDEHEQAYRFLLDVEKAVPDEIIGAVTRLRRAIYAIYRGDLQAAILLAESGLGHPSCDVRTRGALLLTKAKILKARGQTVEAHAYALEAMQVAARAKSSHLCHRVCKFLNRLVRGE